MPDEYAQRERHHRQQLVVTVFTIAVSAIALYLTVTSQQKQLDESNQQFHTSLSRSEYSEIVSGLASSSVAVKNSSLRRLVRFTLEDSNFDDSDVQENAFGTALATLTGFIIDESLKDGRVGLSTYYNPQPIIVPRAMQLLSTLTSDDMARGVADFSGADLHGASLRDFAPTTHFFAANVDFRRATLTGLDLTREKAVYTLRNSFLTCAALSNTKFGAADLAGTDFTGADLSGADLSHVIGLEQEQLHGATVTSKTKLPANLDASPTPGWGLSSDRCYDLVNDMTGMRGGQGYTDRIPCPTDEKVMQTTSFKPAWQGNTQDLIAACRMREPLH